SEVQYFCFHPINGEDRDLALASNYSKSDQALLEESYGTLQVCRYLGTKNLHVIDATRIKAFVAMFPF
ncbi:hypothetical protein BDN72DRAFT_735359, partial [Pluteus cervinus]